MTVEITVIGRKNLCIIQSVKMVSMTVNGHLACRSVTDCLCQMLIIADYFPLVIIFCMPNDLITNDFLPNGLSRFFLFRLTSPLIDQVGRLEVAIGQLTKSNDWPILNE